MTSLPTAMYSSPARTSNSISVLWQVKQYGDPVDVLGIVNDKAGGQPAFGMEGVFRSLCLYLYLSLDQKLLGLSISAYIPCT